MGQGSSWEADSRSASLLWNAKIQYCVQNSPLLVPILSRMYPVHTHVSYFLEIHFNIILTSTPRSSERTVPFRLSSQNFLRIPHRSHACYISSSSYHLDLIIPIISGEEYKLWSASLYNFLHPPINSSLSDSNILLRTLFWNTLNLCSVLNVTDQVSHPYKQQVKLHCCITLYVFRFQTGIQKILNCMAATIPRI
jgi:hypothetical protein